MTNRSDYIDYIRDIINSLDSDDTMKGDTIPLRPEAAQHFTDAARRIAAIIQLHPRLMPER